MSQIVSYLTKFLKDDFSWKYYGYILIFLAISIYFNYSISFERTVIVSKHGTWTSILFYFLFYSVAFFGALLPRLGKASYQFSLDFWVKSLFLITLLALDGGFFWHHDFLNTLYKEQIIITSYEEFSFITHLANNAYRGLIYVPAFGILYVFFDKNLQNWYGLSIKNFNLKPYVFFLVLMVLPILWASFQPDFQQIYPQFKPWKHIGVYGFSAFMLSSIFELFYLSDFFFVEWIFRGVMVLSLAKIMGKDVILPMVCVYAYLHFGKPMPEAVGSIFGGYLLGIISYYSKSILGGCLIHIGVAFLMEIMALGQHYLN